MCFQTQVLVHLCIFTVRIRMFEILYYYHSSISFPPFCILPFDVGVVTERLPSWRREG